MAQQIHHSPVVEIARRNAHSTHIRPGQAVLWAGCARFLALADAGLHGEAAVVFGTTVDVAGFLGVVDAREKMRQCIEGARETADSLASMGESV